MKTILDNIDDLNEALSDISELKIKLSDLEMKFTALKRSLENSTLDIKDDSHTKSETEVNIFNENFAPFQTLDKNIIYDKDMIPVAGGIYKPSFYHEERRVLDLYVSRYPMTQEKWRDVMKTSPSDFNGPKRPVESITWIDALKCCNKLSEKYGFKPLYNISDGVLVSVLQLDGEEVAPNLADFERTEGYRLPTELEWEWFARGGNIGILRNTFNTKYAGSNNINEVAWYDENSMKQTRDVGEKKPNELGLYDICGNVWEWVYDSAVISIPYLREDKAYIYDTSNSSRRLRGGSWNNGAINTEVTSRSAFRYANYHYGFRVVRTKR